MADESLDVNKTKNYLSIPQELERQKFLPKHLNP